MKSLSAIASGLLGLLVLGSLAAFLLFVVIGQRQGAPQALAGTPSQAAYPPPGTPMPPATSTPLPYPGLDTPTPLPAPTHPIYPTLGPWTPPPKTIVPSLTPTITPIPTALALPESAFHALWAESFPDGQGSVLWLADPKDLGHRREVIRFAQEAMSEVALSPDGRQLALVTFYRNDTTVWLARADGSGLKQLDLGPGVGGQLRWSGDGRLLSYSVSWRAETMTPGVKDSTPVAVTVRHGAIDLWDTKLSEQRRLLTMDHNTTLVVLGWSANGQELYYYQSVQGAAGMELWAIDRNGQNARKVASLAQDRVPLTLSMDRSKIMLRTPTSFAWLSSDGRIQQDIAGPGWSESCGLIWSAQADEMVQCQIDQHQPVENIKLLNLRTGTTQEIGSFNLTPNNSPLGLISISPDLHWIAASAIYQSEIDWINLSSGAMVVVPLSTTLPILAPVQRLIFVGWIPRERG